jgi:hypothetical protein
MVNSRAMAVQRKGMVEMVQAWRAAEAGRLRQLPQDARGWRLTWTQMDIRCISSGHAK